MAKKIYLVSFLTTDSDPYIGQRLHAFVDGQPDWAHYTDGVYFVVSKEDMQTITDMITGALGSYGKFFILHLRKDTEYSGRHVKQMWKWIKKYLK